MFLNVTFRQMFPEFTDPGQYPDTMVNGYSTIALSRLDSVRWGELYDYGTMLMVAHYLTLARRDALAARAGKAGGAGITGLVTSKAVGPVSVSYDTGSVTAQGAGPWNATRYGAELWVLMGQIGAGGIQVDSQSYPYESPWAQGYFGGY